MAVQNAAASLSGSSSLTATTTVLAAAVLAVTGLSSVSAAAKVQHKAASSITGQSSTDFTGGADEAAALLVGKAIFYSDPTKVLVIPFFKPTSVPSQYSAPTIPAIRPQVPGNSSSNVQISLNRSPPKTQTGGVPNKG